MELSEKIEEIKAEERGARKNARKSLILTVVASGAIYTIIHFLKEML